MIDCCIDAMAVYEQRKNIDKNPRIVMVPMPGEKSNWSFYMADDYVSNVFSKASPIPCYEGLMNKAPEVYKLTDFALDEELMDEVQSRINLIHLTNFKNKPFF